MLEVGVFPLELTVLSRILIGYNPHEGLFSKWGTHPKPEGFRGLTGLGGCN